MEMLATSLLTPNPLASLSQARDSPINTSLPHHYLIVVLPWRHWSRADLPIVGLMAWVGFVGDGKAQTNLVRQVFVSEWVVVGFFAGLWWVWDLFGWVVSAMLVYCCFLWLDAGLLVDLVYLIRLWWWFWWWQVVLEEKVVKGKSGEENVFVWKGRVLKE